MAERVRFPSTTGPILAGLVDLPEGDLRGWAVFAHGFTLGKDSPAASRICKQLASEGIGVLRFDNLDAHGRMNENSLHTGLPVKLGHKWICTLWMRQNTLRML